MKRYYTSEAIVLSRRVYGEADLIVSLLTSSGMVVSGLAKNALKSKRRFGAAFDLFVCGETTWQDSKKDLVLFTESKIKEAHYGIRTSYDATIAANYASELILKLFGESEKDPLIYENFSSFLGSISGKCSIESARQTFALRMLSLAGYEPNLSSCLQCRRLDQDVLYSYCAQGHGMICGKCSTVIPIDSVTAGVLMSIRRISNPKVVKYEGLRLSEGTLRFASNLIGHTLGDIGVKLRSESFLSC